MTPTRNNAHKSERPLEENAVISKTPLPQSSASDRDLYLCPSKFLRKSSLFTPLLRLFLCGKVSQNPTFRYSRHHSQCGRYQFRLTQAGESRALLACRRRTAVRARIVVSWGRLPPR